MYSKQRNKMNSHPYRAKTKGSRRNIRIIVEIFSSIKVLFLFTVPLISVSSFRSQLCRSTRVKIPSSSYVYINKVSEQNGRGNRYPALSSPLRASSTDLDTSYGIRKSEDPNDDNSLTRLKKSMESLSLQPEIQEKLCADLIKIGFVTTNELESFAKDFLHRPEVLSSVLINDFGVSPLHANYIRASLVHMMTKSSENSIRDFNGGSDHVDANDHQSTGPREAKLETGNKIKTDLDKDTVMDSALGRFSKKKSEKKANFKSVVVNEKAKKRKQKSITKTNKSLGNVEIRDTKEYGLPRNYSTLYPALSSELDNFNTFMTNPMAVLSQEPPIRQATADVYMRHAKLFLGWYLSVATEDEKSDISDNISLYQILPNKERSSASLILKFVLFLRSERQISVSYEANLLRGIIKLVKFRFADESKTDPGYKEKSYEDIPLVNEIRKLHCDANRKQVLSPRSSEEGKKWLEWGEYLQVVKTLGDELKGLKDSFHKLEMDAEMERGEFSRKEKNFMILVKKIATLYQHYLILSFFSCVPDRQRTIRELEIGKTFYKVTNGETDTNGNNMASSLSQQDVNSYYVIKHGPDDYKTGKAYGDRPPLVLSTSLTSSIDDFILNWRPYLMNEHAESGERNFLFLQPRTGNPLTQDSVYQIVSRCCYRIAGKRTNPHLLRDMIVTHVRHSSNASEKELEALALYMGHSIAMQRSSYDRRTMEQKVAPAVELLLSVNKDN